MSIRPLAIPSQAIQPSDSESGTYNSAERQPTVAVFPILPLPAELAAAISVQFQVVDLKLSPEFFGLVPRDVADVVLVAGADVLDLIPTCLELRNQKVECTILGLAQTDWASSHASFFRAGGDDIVFDSKFVPARLAHLSRTHLSHISPTITLRSLSLNLHSRFCHVDGAPLRLSEKEFSVLRLLLFKVGQVLTIDDIHRAVWGLESPTSEATARAAISRLRCKLRAHNSPATVVCAPGHGYRLTEVSDLV